MTVRLSRKMEYMEFPPIDERGRPTTYLAFQILETTFHSANHRFTVEELARLLSANPTDTRLLCRQLEETDLLSGDQTEPHQYRYNRRSKNDEIQIKFEKFLVDVEVGGLPVHLTLDYSPSHRSYGRRHAP